MLASGLMKQLLSVLLVFVLSLQVAVAGIHGVGETAEHLAAKTILQTADSEVAPNTDAGSPCCPWSHGCHGVHNVLPAYSTEMVTLTIREVFLQDSDSASFNWVPTPFDRPKWLAA